MAMSIVEAVESHLSEVHNLVQNLERRKRQIEGILGNNDDKVENEMNQKVAPISIRNNTTKALNTKSHVSFLPVPKQRQSRQIGAKRKRPKRNRQDREEEQVQSKSENQDPCDQNEATCNSSNKNDNKNSSNQESDAENLINFDIIERARALIQKNALENIHEDNHDRFEVDSLEGDINDEYQDDENEDIASTIKHVDDSGVLNSYMWVPLSTRGMVTVGSGSIFFNVDCREENTPKVGQIVKVAKIEYRITSVDDHLGLRITLDKDITKAESEARLKNGLTRVFVKFDPEKVTTKQINRARFCGSGSIHHKDEVNNNVKQSVNRSRARRNMIHERKMMAVEDETSKAVAKFVHRKKQLEQKAAMLQEKTKKRLKLRRQHEEARRKEEMKQKELKELERVKKEREAHEKAIQAAKLCQKRILHAKRKSKYREKGNRKEIELEKDDESVVSQATIRTESSQVAGEKLQRLAKQRIRQAYMLKRKEEERKQKEQREHEEKVKLEQQQREENAPARFAAEQQLKIESQRRREKFARIAQRVKETEEERYRWKKSTCKNESRVQSKKKKIKALDHLNHDRHLKSQNINSQNSNLSNKEQQEEQNNNIVTDRSDQIVVVVGDQVEFQVFDPDISVVEVEKASSSACIKPAPSVASASSNIARGTYLFPN